MGLALRKAKKYTPEEYLEFERSADERHEYIDGYIYPVNREVYAMAGESLAHSHICINIAAEFRNRLKGSNCEALSPNMKVRAESKSMYAYPDLSIVCGGPVFLDTNKDVLLNPKVIIEVLSPSTERYDQTKKFMRYRKEIESLSDYLLIHQNRPFIEHYEKDADGRWGFNAYDGPNAVLKIRSIDSEIPISEIYDRVEFSADEPNIRGAIAIDRDDLPPQN